MKANIKTTLYCVLMIFANGAHSQALPLASEQSNISAPIEQVKNEKADEAEKISSIVGDQININAASAPELAKALKGVGPKKAAAIVAFRDLHGPFQHVEELVEVKGIGPVLLEKNMSKLALK